MRTQLATASLLAFLPTCALVTHEHSTVQMQWAEQASGVTASLRGVSAVDADVAWASGSDGTWLRTLDGGSTWESGQVAGLEQLDFRDVQAFSAEQALLVSAGEPARFVSTSDGGQTWTTRHADDTPGVFFDAADFWDPLRGLAFSDPLNGKLHIVRTTDGGARWAALPNTPQALPGEAGFAASGSCLETLPGSDSAWIGLGGATGRPARVLVTHDVGETWQSFDTPFPSTASGGVFSIAFRDANHGVIVGGDYQAPNSTEWTAATTDDGGRTWHISERTPGGFRSAVRFVPGAPVPTCVAAGTSGVDISVDGGRTWAALHPTGYNALDFAPSGSGWAVGAEGRVGRITIPDPR